MECLLNIPARFSTIGEWGKGGDANVKGRLLLTETKILFGKPRFFSTDVKEADLIFTMGRERPEGVEVYEDGLLLKQYAVRIILPERRDFLGCERENIVLWAKRDHAEEFVRVWTSEHEEYRDDVYHRERMRNEIRSRGRIVIPELAEELLEHYREGFDKPQASQETAERYIRSYIQECIAGGRMSGILQDDVYTDRDLIVEQHKVVNVNVDLDFNTLFGQLGSKGIIVQTLECPQCGANCSPPSGGDSFVCESCGSTVHAVDVFDKFKSLLA